MPRSLGIRGFGRISLGLLQTLLPALLLALLASQLSVSSAQSSAQALETYPVPSGSHPHDVARATGGPGAGIWYTAQGTGELGWLDPASGETRHVALGPGSRPHGVILGPDGAPWVTDGGLNAIVRVDPATSVVT
ncbi:MAG TPA: hypothetical protein VFD39_04625, partial [Trueperaceae bacterium]|nr:hypothetical protein [Trueperaceae bacterium]